MRNKFPTNADETQAWKIRGVGGYVYVRWNRSFILNSLAAVVHPGGCHLFEGLSAKNRMKYFFTLKIGVLEAINSVIGITVSN